MAVRLMAAEVQGSVRLCGGSVQGSRLGHSSVCGRAELAIRTG